MLEPVDLSLEQKCIDAITVLKKSVKLYTEAVDALMAKGEGSGESVGDLAIAAQTCLKQSVQAMFAVLKNRGETT